MKRLIYSSILAATLIFTATIAAAQTSDYQVKKNFEEQYLVLKTSIRNAMTVSEIDNLKEKITAFASKNKDHEKLLDNALYPESFGGSIKELKQKARNAEHKLLIIENQNEKLARLSNELSSYKLEIKNLNSRTESLQKAITDSKKSESDLSELVKRYRNNLQQHDDLVLNMIDSLFINYKDLKGEELADFTGDSKSRALQGNNPLEVIQSVIVENIQILKSGNELFQTEDYLRMYVVQSRFSEVWNYIGDDLVNLYGGSNSSQWEANIEDKLTDWKYSASKNMWASIDEHLEQNNVSLGAFDNNESFYNAIESFISKATDASREKVITSENYDDFQAFYDFWNGKIKSEWGRFVQEGEVLTMQQISTIDNEMMNWRDEAKPKALIIPILFGFSLLTIIGLIILIAR